MLCLIIRLSYMPDEFMSFTYIQSYFVNVTIMLVDTDVLLNTYVRILFSRKSEDKTCNLPTKEAKTLYESLDYVKSWCIYSNLVCMITFVDFCDKIYGQFQQTRNIQLNKDRSTWWHLLYYFTIYCSTCFECYYIHPQEFVTYCGFFFHVLYCSGSMCVGVTVWFGWGGVVSLCRLKH